MVRVLAAKGSVQRVLLVLATLVLAGVLLALWSGPAEAAATFTVNRTGDASDRNINNSVCDVSRTRGNQCTLRAAIEEANNTPGADLIRFNIGGTASVKIISPTRPLPVINDPVTINGYTQRGARANTNTQGNNAVLKVQLNGTSAGENTNGLAIEASNSTIRGLVISRFDRDGVEIKGSGATGNKVEGNFIGTNAAGTSDLGNGVSGVSISGADNTTVGGTDSAARNVISGNNFRGLLISGPVEAGNEVLGNYIGTDKHGSGDLGNGFDGVLLQGAENTTIGGTTSGAGNVISGNGSSGVHISGATSTANKVEGSFIGTTADGSGDLGNGLDGVSIIGAPTNTIGGTASGARNIISGNDANGVQIRGTGATGNDVSGNFVGTTADGSGALGNGFGGVFIQDAVNNTVGGTASGAGNRIAHNGDDGVEIVGGVDNRILSNLIFTNAGLGINLGANGVTDNDVDPNGPNDDTDTGSNNLQNFPIITSVIQSSTFLNPTRISGTLNSKPNQTFTVQCFLASETPEDTDPSGHGEGRGFVADDTDVRTDANGGASFECNFLFPVSLEGKRWSATATDEDGNTSEFSANFPAG